ncbi:hypothetical protein BDDG_01067 [Blastomyces dermatitidis ATCC 18188]|uniref:Uncharacterized protein n=1 Tax=Ajellomyces dermatitidis (strain ATCC 18188 / CBS 674.68) TaxID=653446 RepID=F2T3X8_AJEDA|nr:hypothetical protein BDDG_01067 [Blastomyces dermatitidis ATCC 18188]
MAFTDIKKLFTTVKFNITETSALMNFFRMIDLYQSILWYLLSDFVMQAKDIHVFRNENMDVVLFYTHRFAPVSEAILIEDDNITETTLFHSQASSVTSSSSPAEKVVHTSDHKFSALSGFCCLSDSASSSSSVSSASVPPALTPGPAGLMLSFNFSTHTHAHFYIGISANLAINDINVIHRAVEKSETCTVLLQEQLATLKSLADLKF